MWSLLFDAIVIRYMFHIGSPVALCLVTLIVYYFCGFNVFKCALFCGDVYLSTCEACFQELKNVFGSF